MVDTGRHDISALSPSCSNLSSSSLNTLNTSISSLSSSNYLLPITSSHNQKLLGTLSSPTDHCLLISTSLTEQSHLNIDVSLPNSLTSRSSFSLDETIEEDSTFYQCQARQGPVLYKIFLLYIFETIQIIYIICIVSNQLVILYLCSTNSFIKVTNTGKCT